ncbi:hypothetical protein Tcan_02043 [Toxocara canis]|uniref:Uncharacterized protein n=1 Tax=Toxocara canis TaxID=6265 RepID=A0A0B2URU7_TOXCA|nr:hypothetical protein Tcan_02043 [Toxocara canis]
MLGRGNNDCQNGDTKILCAGSRRFTEKGGIRLCDVRKTSYGGILAISRLEQMFCVGSRKGDGGRKAERENTVIDDMQRKDDHVNEHSEDGSAMLMEGRQEYGQSEDRMGDVHCGDGHYRSASKAVFA